MSDFSGEDHISLTVYMTNWGSYFVRNIIRPPTDLESYPQFNNKKRLTWRSSQGLPTHPRWSIPSTIFLAWLPWELDDSFWLWTVWNSQEEDCGKDDCGEDDCGPEFHTKTLHLSRSVPRHTSQLWWRWSSHRQYLSLPIYGQQHGVWLQSWLGLRFQLQQIWFHKYGQFRLGCWCSGFERNIQLRTGLYGSRIIDRCGGKDTR